MDTSIVMNEDGKIVSWQLTKRTSLAEVQYLLENLKSRSQAIQVVYIDDCCKLRRKIHSVFGRNVLVKLDLFHATQRITKTLSKANDLFYNCVQDLRLVFRKDGDSGKKRQSDTPDSMVMMQHIDMFENKWKNVSDTKGRSIFSTQTASAITNLKRHIKNGCLSEIPPGAGTNKNERFHHHINSLFKRSKMGILLAYALLIVVIHWYNSSEHKHGKLISRPIAAAAFRRSRDSDVPIMPVGITPKDRNIQSTQETCHWEIDISESTIDLHLVVEMYTVCIEKFRLMKSLLSMGLQNFTDFTTDLTSFIPTPAQSTLVNSQVSSIHQKLHRYGLQPVSVSGDGNCFFSAVAYSMLRNQELWNATFSLAGISVTTDLTATEVVTSLRQAFVKELLGVRRSKYEEFIVQDSIDYVPYVLCYSSPWSSSRQMQGYQQCISHQKLLPVMLLLSWCIHLRMIVN